MKKIISVLLALAMVLSLVPTVFAADKPNFSLEADKLSVAPGESVNLTLKVDSDVTVGSAAIKITFDSTAYTLVSATGNLGAQMSQSFTPVTTANTKGYVKMTTLLVGANGTWNAGTIATYTFTAKEGVDAATAKFTLDVDDLAVYGDDLTTLEDVAHTVSGGELTIPVETAAAKGYTVSLGADKQVASGQIVEIPVAIGNNDGKTTYNAYDMTFSFDPAILTLNMKATSIEGYRVIPGNGTVQIVRYGKAAELGDALTLSFVAAGQGKSDVKVTKACVDTNANAIDYDAPAAAILDDTAVITVSGYTVSLPDDFTRTGTAGTVIMEGDNLTFVPKDPNYNYTVTVTVGGGEATTVSPDENGIYTVANVTGNVVVTSTKTPKSFNVTLGADTTGATTATYQTDYTFKLTPVKDFVYNVKVTIGDTDYTGFTAQKNDDGTTTYTIPGAAITGDIVINSNKKERDPYTFQVTFEGTGIGDVSNNATTVTENAPYSFTLTKKDGFDYTVSATMDGAAVELTETVDTGNANVVTYSIAKVTGDLVITVNKVSTLNMDVAVSEYVQMDDKTVFLVTVTGTPTEGMAYAYGENTMYKTTAYGENVYSWLVIVDKNQEFTADTAKANIKEASATAEEMAPSYDVNETKTVDINDAQLVYDIYSGKYGDFDKVTVRKFLRADVNLDKAVNSTDAVAVVTASK